MCFEAASTRSHAFGDAESRAERYAVLAGLKLIDVITISEVGSRDDNHAPKIGAADSFQRHPDGDLHSEGNRGLG